MPRCPQKRETSQRDVSTFQRSRLLPGADLTKMRNAHWDHAW
jgi:hypothetical protein